MMRTCSEPCLTFYTDNVADSAMSAMEVFMYIGVGARNISYPTLTKLQNLQCLHLGVFMYITVGVSNISHPTLTKLLTADIVCNIPIWKVFASLGFRICLFQWITVWMSSCTKVLQWAMPHFLHLTMLLILWSPNAFIYLHGCWNHP